MCGLHENSHILQAKIEPLFAALRSNYNVATKNAKEEKQTTANYARNLCL